LNAFDDGSGEPTWLPLVPYKDRFREVRSANYCVNKNAQRVALALRSERFVAVVGDERS